MAMYVELDVDELFFAEFLMNSTIGEALFTFLNFHKLNFLFRLIKMHKVALNNI